MGQRRTRLEDSKKRNARNVNRPKKKKNRYAYEEEYYDMKPRKKKKKRSNASVGRYEDIEPRRNGRKDARRNNKKRAKRRGRRENSFSKTIGIILAMIQFILSVVLVVNVIFLDMLTSTYILVLAGILVILLGVTLLSQIGAKGKGMTGKIFCIFLCIVLALGSFYINKVYHAFNKIVGGNTMTSSISVAVMADDSADTLADAMDYTFGVQYATNGAQTTSAIEQINSELNTQIETVAYSGLINEAQALYDGEVDAIIFNASQTSIITDQLHTFEEDIKIIYTHSIVVEIENSAVDASMSEPFAVYLSGIDVYGDISQESRSDVNIVAVVNPESHQVLLVSTPRDYYVEIPGISNGQEDKLTHAGTYGVEASMTTLEELYDLEIPFYVRVNFTTLIDVVDALGGLDVQSDTTFTTSSAAGSVVQVQEGMNHFNGEEALAFCRERKNLPDGDNARGRHQQAVITAMIQKMMSPSMLRAAPEIMESVSDGIDMNFTADQIQTLIKTQLRTNATWNVYSVSAEGYGDRKSCYSSGDTPLYVTIPDETSVANIIDLIDRVERGEIIEGSTKSK